MAKKQGCSKCKVWKSADGGLHHAPDCVEMFFGGDRSKPRGEPNPVETELLHRRYLAAKAE